MSAIRKGLIINGGFALALAILVSIGWLTQRYMTATDEYSRWEDHTYVVILEWEGLISALKDAETGVRGFVITGNGKFLRLYDEALGRIDQKLARLRQKGGEDRRHPDRLGGIEPLIREKLAMANTIVKLRSAGGFQAASRAVVTNRDLELMDEIRRQVGEAEGDEGQLLKKLSAAKDASAQKARQALHVGSIVSFSLLFLVFLLLRREISQHAKAEEELRRHRDHLEELILERTSLLEQAKLAAEAASLAKGEFLANMGHEMRTPLTEIMGIIDLMLTNDLPAEHRRHLEMVRTSAEAFKHLINDILDFSSGATGQMSFRREPFQLRSCIHSAVDIFAMQADRKGLRFLLEIDDHVPPRVVGDEGRLRQVLLNLVGNAVKFTEHGEIVVSVRPEPDLARPGQVPLLFVIRDTGIGIPAEYMANIFEMFSQADAAATKKFSGAGLGLALSKQIVENLGGKIRVESQRGAGTVISFMIPFVDNHQEDA